MEYVVNNEVFSVSVRDYEGGPFNQALMYIQNVIKKTYKPTIKITSCLSRCTFCENKQQPSQKKNKGRTNKEWAPVMKQTNESQNNERTNDQTEETNKPANIRTKEPKNDNLRMKERTTKRMSQWGPRNERTHERTIEGQGLSEWTNDQSHKPTNELLKTKQWTNGRTNKRANNRINKWTNEATNKWINVNILFSFAEPFSGLLSVPP